MSNLLLARISLIMVNLRFQLEDVTFQFILSQLISRHIQKNSVSYLETELSKITYYIKLVLVP